MSLDHIVRSVAGRLSLREPQAESLQIVLLMDQSHRYRAGAGVRALNEFKPVLSMELTATPFAAVAQTIYHDPQGRLDLQIPAGWRLTLDQDADQIIVRKGAVQEIIVVQPFGLTGQVL